MRIELVVWRDAGGSEDDYTWMNTEDVDDANPIIKSVGWLIKETAANLTIATDLADDGTTHSRSRIPIGMVIAREVLHDTDTRS